MVRQFIFVVLTQVVNTAGLGDNCERSELENYLDPIPSGFAAASFKTKSCCFSGGHFVYDHTNCSFTAQCYRKVNTPRSRSEMFQ